VKVTATLLKFGEESSPDVWGDVATFAKGSLYQDQGAKVPLLLHAHDRQSVAAGVADRVYVEGDTVRGDFTLLDTDAGRQAALELAAGLRMDVSVGVAIDTFTTEPLDAEDPNPWAPQRVTIESADLIEVSLCLRGRMPSAQVDAVSADQEGIPA
jgi:phage head maturation protease